MSAYALTIGGKPSPGSGTFDVLNPADGSVVAACPQGSVALVDAAVESARGALAAWAGLADAERVAKLMAVADLIDQHHAALSELVTREQGKTQSGPGANFEVHGAAAWTRVTAGLQLPEETIQDDAKQKIVVRRKPVGVVGSITPWNWPLIIAAWHVMPALRVGCTVVIKPSPFTPLSTLKLVELMNQVLPPGVINAVTGGPEVGNHMALHPGINKIVFTGSIPTGKKVMGGAAQTLKRVTLELGGNDAGIVLPGTNIEPLLEKLFWGCFINAGQTCAALKRLYVHADQYEDVVQKFAAYVRKIPVGDGLDPKNLIGPVSNKMQLDKVTAYVDDARAQGARIVTGGARHRRAGLLLPADRDRRCHRRHARGEGRAVRAGDPHHQVQDRGRGDPARQLARRRARRLGVGQRCAGSRPPREPARVRHGLGEPARRPAPARPIRRREVLRHRHRVQRRWPEGVHHHPGGEHGALG